MSKGDSVEVMVGTPDGSQTFALVASKAGRVVRQTTRSRKRVEWLDVEEMTRTAKVTGNRMSFRLTSVLAVRETTTGLPDEPKAAKPRKPREAAPESLGLDA